MMLNLYQDEREHGSDDQCAHCSKLHAPCGSCFHSSVRHGSWGTLFVQNLTAHIAPTSGYSLGG